MAQFLRLSKDHQIFPKKNFDEESGDLKRLYNKGLNEEEDPLTYNKWDVLIISLAFIISPFLLKKVGPYAKVTLTINWIWTTICLILFCIGYVQNNQPIMYVFIAVIFIHVLELSMNAQAVITVAKKHDYKGSIKALTIFVFAIAELKKKPDLLDLYWLPLTGAYNVNLDNHFSSVGGAAKFIQDCRDQLRWVPKGNGLELLKLMSSFSYKLYFTRFAFFSYCFIGILALGAIHVILGHVVENDLFGITLRIYLTFLYTSSANNIGLTTFGGSLFQYNSSISPENFISLEKIYKEDKNDTIIIDIFSKESLRTFLTCYLTIRKAVRKLSAKEELVFYFGFIFGIVFAAVIAAILFFDDFKKEEYGYGFLVIMMIMLIYPLVYVTFFHLFFGSNFNSVQENMLKKLNLLCETYTLMERTKDLPKGDAKLEFLFECVKGKDIDFRDLKEYVEELITEVECEEKCKFLGIFESTTPNIATAFVPLLGLLWTALIYFISIADEIISR